MVDHLLQGWVCCLELSHGLKVSVTAVQGNDRVGVHPGECVCCSVGRSTDMADIRGELGHEIQVPGLSGRMTVVVGLEGEGEWTMIRHHEKVSALHEMPEVPDGQIHRQEIPVKRAVPGLCRL